MNIFLGVIILVKTNILSPIPDEEWPWIKRFFIDQKIKTWQAWYKHDLFDIFNYTRLSLDSVYEIQWRLAETVPHLHRIDLNNLSDIKQASMPYLPSIHNYHKHWFEDLPYQILVRNFRKYYDLETEIGKAKVKTISQLRSFLQQTHSFLPYYRDFYHQVTSELNLFIGKKITSFSQLTEIVPELTWQNYFSHINLNQLLTAALNLKNFKALKAELYAKKIITNEDLLSFDFNNQILTICLNRKYYTTCILKPKHLALPSTTNPVLADIYTCLLKYLLFPFTHQQVVTLYHQNYHILANLLSLPLKQVLQQEYLFEPTIIHKFDSMHNLTLEQFLQYALSSQIPNFSPQTLRSIFCGLDYLWLAQNKSKNVIVINF